MLAIREITGKYKGTLMGMTWALVEPLFLLGVYTFVFSVIFRGDWSEVADGGITAAAPVLFMGLMTFSLFADVVAMAPALILQNRNFVNKVVFPLEVLPVVSLSNALVAAFFSLVVLLIYMLVVYHTVPVTLLLLPMVWFPMLFLSLGVSYFLASIGVFVRDLGTIIGIIVLALRFLTPLFYPATMLPKSIRTWFEVNPLAIFVNCSRRVALWGMIPDWPLYIGGTIFAVIVLLAGYTWFMASKHAFADVI
jgi:lipopolysaccharide transport system permease protein